MKRTILACVMSVVAASAFADRPFIGAGASLGNGQVGAGANIGGLSVGAGAGVYNDGVRVGANVDRDGRYWDEKRAEGKYYKEKYKNKAKEYREDRGDWREYERYDDDRGNHYGQKKEHPVFGVNPSVRADASVRTNCYRTGFLWLRTVCE